MSVGADAPSSTRSSRRHRFPILALVVSASSVARADPPLTPEASRLVAPVHAAFLRVEAAQRREGPPKDVAARLVRLGETVLGSNHHHEQSVVLTLARYRAVVHELRFE